MWNNKFKGLDRVVGTKIAESPAEIPEQTSKDGKSEQPLSGYVSEQLRDFLSKHWETVYPGCC